MVIWAITEIKKDKLCTNCFGDAAFNCRYADNDNCNCKNNREARRETLDLWGRHSLLSQTVKVQADKIPEITSIQRLCSFHAATSSGTSSNYRMLVQALPSSMSSSLMSILSFILRRLRTRAHERQKHLKAALDAAGWDKASLTTWDENRSFLLLRRLLADEVSGVVAEVRSEVKHVHNMLSVRGETLNQRTPAASTS